MCHHSITITSLNPASSPLPQHHSGTPGTGGLGLDYLARTASGSFHTEPRAPLFGVKSCPKNRNCRISLGLYVLSALLTRMCCSEMLGLFLSFFFFFLFSFAGLYPSQHRVLPKTKVSVCLFLQKKKILFSRPCGTSCLLRVDTQLIFIS